MTLSPSNVVVLPESDHIEDACKWLNRMTDGETHGGTSGVGSTASDNHAALEGV